MKSSEYWAKREAEALKHRITDEKEYERQIKKIYAEMIDNCQKEINSFYVKYANAEGISLAEAKKRVSKLDIAAYERKAARYVKDKDFSKQANEEMRLYNATMKINRLEMLKANLGLELISGHNELEKFMGGILKGRTEDELARQAGILGKTIKNPAENAKSIVNASFHNANFSNRIWLYQDVMKADLERLLKTGIIQGKNPNVLARELNKRFDVGRANAERLMRTELARVQTEAQRQSFERNGFTEYEFIVNGNCCDICAAINGKHFKVKDMQAGENAPPMHPNCRCSTAAYEDSTEYNAWLEHLNNGGTTAEWEKLSKPEKEESKTKYSYKETVIDKNVIEAAEYRRRIDKISNNTEVNRSVWSRAKEILLHRSGTKFEDLAFIDSKSGKSLINKAFDKENSAKPNGKMLQMLKTAKPYTIIGIHNHPGNTVPSIPDIKACIDRKYKCGIVLCHDGKIYKYTVKANKFNEPLAVSALDRMEKIGYNSTVKKIFSDAGIEMEVL